MIDFSGEQLVVGGYAIDELIRTYGEPLYVYDGDAVQERCRQLRIALPGWRLLYSVKANPNAALVRLCDGLLDGLDVSSAGEILRAHAAGCRTARMMFVGPSKSGDELRFAIAQGVTPVVESLEELQCIAALACSESGAVPILIRINPKIELQGAKLQMSGVPRQFGIDEEDVDRACVEARASGSVIVRGFHTYLGTRVMDWRVAARMVHECLERMSIIAERNAVELQACDVGAGLGVPYFAGEAAFDLTSFGAAASDSLAAVAARWPRTVWFMELGRYIVAEAGLYVTRVRYTKRSRGERFALVSGGMNHFQAASAIGGVVRRSFSVLVLNKLRAEATDKVTICGPLCTPMDVLAREVMLPPLAAGDLIGIPNAGAYGSTASPMAFLSHPEPIELMVTHGRAECVCERQPEPLGV